MDDPSAVGEVGNFSRESHRRINFAFRFGWSEDVSTNEPSERSRSQSSKSFREKRKRLLAESTRIESTLMNAISSDATSHAHLYARFCSRHAQSEAIQWTPLTLVGISLPNEKPKDRKTEFTKAVINSGWAVRGDWAEPRRVGSSRVGPTELTATGFGMWHFRFAQQQPNRGLHTRKNRGSKRTVMVEAWRSHDPT